MQGGLEALGKGRFWCRTWEIVPWFPRFLSQKNLVAAGRAGELQQAGMAWVGHGLWALDSPEFWALELLWVVDSWNSYELWALEFPLILHLGVVMDCELWNFHDFWALEFPWILSLGADMISELWNSHDFWALEFPWFLSSGVPMVLSPEELCPSKDSCVCCFQPLEGDRQWHHPQGRFAHIRVCSQTIVELFFIFSSPFLGSRASLQPTEGLVKGVLPLYSWHLSVWLSGLKSAQEVT